MERMFLIKKKIKRWSKYGVPVVVWAGVIFAFSSYPTGTATEIVWTDFILKKTAHVVEYGILTMLGYRALVNSGISMKRAAMVAVLLSMVYGLSDEYHQSFTPGREPKLRDVGFDTIGALLAIYTIWKLLPKAPARLRSWAKSWEVI
jgi:hypothetical protein